MSGKADVSDVLPLIFVAPAPPLISFFGAAAVANAAEDVIYTANNVAARQEFVEKFIWFPALQLAVANAAMRISIYSGLAKRLAPWLLAAGFAALLMSILSYGRFFPMLNEGWGEMTQLLYILSPFPTYLIAAGRLVHDYD
jgi:hypothetical protein